MNHLLLQYFSPTVVFDSVDKLFLLQSVYITGPKKQILSTKKTTTFSQPLAPAPASAFAPAPAPASASSSQIKTSTQFYPNRRHSLFWSIYIQHMGYNPLLHESKATKLEMEEHAKIAEFLPTAISTAIVKPKITKKYIVEMRSDAMVVTENNLSLLPAYVLYYKKSVVLFLTPYIYYQIIHQDSLDTLYLVTSGQQYGIQGHPQDLTSCICIESVAGKPLRPSTFYKMDELYDMLKRLHVENWTKKMKKTELYVLLESTILEHLHKKN
jgi:hypothetical protein